jgi:hypothetical protein
MRWRKAAALALVVPLSAAGSAVSADAAVDPVAAIQRQLVKGHGVKFVQRDTFNGEGKGWENFEQSGIVGFGKGKVVATDERFPDMGDSDNHLIYVNGRVYDYQPERPHPPGRPWISGKWPVSLTLGSGRITISDPAVFKAVLATTMSRRAGGVYDGVRTTIYEGAITVGQLHRAKPDMVIFTLGGDPAGKYASWKISWRLWIGPDQLVRRVWSSWSQPNVMGNPVFAKVARSIVDVRLSDWGMKADIKPPPVDQTVLAEKMKP